MTLDNKKRVTYIGLLLLFAAVCVIGLRTLFHTNHMINILVLLIFASVGFGLVVSAFLVYLDKIVDWIWRDKTKKNDVVEAPHVKKKVAVRCEALYIANTLMDRYIQRIASQGIVIDKVNYNKLSFETSEVSITIMPVYRDHTGMRFDEVFGFDQATAIYLRANHSQDDYKGDLVDYVVERHELRKRG
jgi:hypothetical protein